MNNDDVQEKGAGCGGARVGCFADGGPGGRNGRG